MPTLLVLFATATFGQAIDSVDPWVLLEELRENLEATPRRASFLQIYKPAGFSSGDREMGHLYLSLPECVRWDYQEPHAKIFLLCENTIYTWNSGDQAGRRFLLADSEEPGIDLLRLNLDDLRGRYDATVEGAPDSSLEIILSPRGESPTITEARVSLDSQRQFLTALSYEDLEGNVSRFEIKEYEPLIDSARFTPPTDIDWLDQ